MVGVAVGGPAGAAVDEVVGDCYAVVAAVAGDDVLAADEARTDMVDPARRLLA